VNIHFKCVRALAWGARRIALAAALVSVVGCRAPRVGESPAHQESEPSAGRSLRSCTPGRDPRFDVKERKDRIAKGVYRVSRRIAVDGGLELWDTPYGRYWVVANNFSTFADVLGEQAVEVYGNAQRGVHSGDVVLDCGAHFGGFARTALDRGARLVIAIEIAPENVQVLQRNLASEIAAGRVIVYPKGVWDKDGTMVLKRSLYTWADQVVPDGQGTSVAVTTIDHIVSELRLPDVDFIKMDIEGAERHALAGAVQTLKTYRPRMALASYHLVDDLDAIPAVALSAEPSYSVCVGGRGLGPGHMTLFFE
jgi:FkbM family methyltransferase